MLIVPFLLLAANQQAINQPTGCRLPSLCLVNMNSAFKIWFKTDLATTAHIQTQNSSSQVIMSFPKLLENRPFYRKHYSSTPIENEVQQTQISNNGPSPHCLIVDFQCLLVHHQSSLCERYFSQIMCAWFPKSHQ